MDSDQPGVSFPDGLPQVRYLPYGILSAVIPMPYENPEAVLDTLGDKGYRSQYEGELAYLRGDFERARDCFFDTLEDSPVKLCAAAVSIAAAISLGDGESYRRIDEYLRLLIREGDGVQRMVKEMPLALAAVGMFLPASVPTWMRKGDLKSLPVPARPYASYIYVKYLQNIGCYDAVLSVSRIALALQEIDTGFTSLDIYLRLMCACGEAALGRLDDARAYLLESLRLALPHGFITPFAECIPALGGLMEQCLECEFPSERAAVVAQWKRTWKNWVSFHNLFSGDRIAWELSLNEYQVAQLIAHGMGYEETARRLGLSKGRVKNIASEVYAKLGIEGKAGLKPFVF